MLKITGGQWRGKTLVSQTAGSSLRPTTGLVREAWFNCVQFQINGARFLDLFSGTGLMSLEALSRGAAFVVAIEQDPQHAAGIHQNYQHFKISEAQSQVIQKDVRSWIKAAPGAYGLQPFDLIYMDPPYAYPHYEETVTALLENGWLTDGGTLGVEADKALQLSPTVLAGWQMREKAYGGTVLTLLTPEMG